MKSTDDLLDVAPHLQLFNEAHEEFFRLSALQCAYDSDHEELYKLIFMDMCDYPKIYKEVLFEMGDIYVERCAAMLNALAHILRHKNRYEECLQVLEKNEEVLQEFQVRSNPSTEAAPYKHKISGTHSSTVETQLHLSPVRNSATSARSSSGPTSTPPRPLPSSPTLSPPPGLAIVSPSTAASSSATPPSDYISYAWSTNSMPDTQRKNRTRRRRRPSPGQIKCWKSLTYQFNDIKIEVYSLLGNEKAAVAALRQACDYEMEMHYDFEQQKWLTALYSILGPAYKQCSKTRLQDLTDDQLWQALLYQSRIEANDHSGPTFDVQLQKCRGCDRLETTRGEFEECVNCLRVVYCSYECQKRHWKIHKKECSTDTGSNTLITTGTNAMSNTSRKLLSTLRGFKFHD